MGFSDSSGNYSIENGFNLGYRDYRGGCVGAGAGGENVDESFIELRLGRDQQFSCTQSGTN